MKNNDEKQKSQEAESPPDIWEALEQAGAEIEHYEVKECNLSGGEHYWILENARQGKVRCASCSMYHGGIIDAHELAGTRLVDGVIYLDGKPTTKKPSDFLVNRVAL